MIDPSRLAPPKRPFVRLYEYIALTLPLEEREPVPSKFLPNGPAATDILPPTVTLPAAMKEATAAFELQVGRSAEAGHQIIIADRLT